MVCVPDVYADAIFTNDRDGHLCDVADFLTISTTGGAINFIVTILRMRAPGMAISKMPLFLYGTLTISCVI